MKNAARDFKEFVLKGDVVALAVAVVIATAFGAVVAAFVANLVTPLIAAIGGQPNFSELDFEINGSRFQYGLFINAVIAFLIIALVVFFLVVRPYNSSRKRYLAQGDDDVPPPEYAVETAGGCPAGAPQRPRRRRMAGRLGRRGRRSARRGHDQGFLGVDRAPGRTGRLLPQGVQRASCGPAGTRLRPLAGACGRPAAPAAPGPAAGNGHSADTITGA